MSPKPSKISLKKKKEMEKVISKVSSARKTLEREPEFMVHINDPPMLRKEILECLRELIILMQGYEQFHKIQQQKVAHIAILDRKLREINNVIDRKLKPHLPKGKLKPLTTLRMPPPEQSMPAKKEPAPKSELDELEAQLKDIEGQLDKVQ